MLTLPCLALLTRLFCVLCVMSGVVGGGETCHLLVIPLILRFLGPIVDRSPDKWEFLAVIWTVSP